jgi:hypothetical protein
VIERTAMTTANLSIGDGKSIKSTGMAKVSKVGLAKLSNAGLYI